MGSAPEVIRPLSDRIIVAPACTRLECEMRAGDPVARIAWYKDDKELRRGARHDMTYEDALASLAIADSIGTDTGDYRCEAVNKLGRAETACKLRVKSE